MGFFSRQKPRLDLVRTGLELAHQEQANRPTTAAGMTARMEGMIAQQEAGLQMRDRVTRLATHGVDTLATLRAVELVQLPTMLQATLDWTVQPFDGEPYEAHSVDAVRQPYAASLVAGAQCTVKVDPQDPQSLMLIDYGPDWTAPAPPAKAESDTAGALDRLTKLAELHSAGLITEDEFATRKAKIIAS